MSARWCVAEWVPEVPIDSFPHVPDVPTDPHPHVLPQSVEREHRRSDSVVQISRYLRRIPNSATIASTVYASVPRNFQTSILRVVHASSSEPWIPATLNGGFSCLLQRRLNSRIVLVCQRNALCMCVQSDSTCPLTACTAQYWLLHVCVYSGQYQRLSDQILCEVAVNQILRKKSRKYINRRNCHQT